MGEVKFAIEFLVFFQKKLDIVFKCEVFIQIKNAVSKCQVCCISQDVCTAIAAALQYLFLVAFALMLTLSVALYWKVSSLARGMRSDKTSDTAISILIAWGEMCIYPNCLLCWMCCLNYLLPQLALINI